MQLGVTLVHTLTRFTEFIAQVLLNGHTSSLTYGTTAYVTQDDVLVNTLTVKECLLFVARLRLPAAVSAASKLAKVNALMGEMGLVGCQDTIVGAWPVKGISGACCMRAFQ